MWGFKNAKDDDVYYGEKEEVTASPVVPRLRDMMRRHAAYVYFIIAGIIDADCRDRGDAPLRCW